MLEKIISAIISTIVGILIKSLYERLKASFNSFKNTKPNVSTITPIESRQSVYISYFASTFLILAGMIFPVYLKDIDFKSLFVIRFVLLGFAGMFLHTGYWGVNELFSLANKTFECPPQSEKQDKFK